MNCGHQIEAGATEGMDGHTTQSATEDLARQIAADATSKGERRTITMLFVDIMGSTAAAEKLGPERWANTMRGAFDRFIAPVERYEGSVARMLGDAILAYFGAPIAHEDDPQRAILAALEIMEATKKLQRELMSEHGVEVNCRIGINTGLVIVGDVGSDMYGEYAALGDAANVAARMEQTAEAGTIQVAEATHRLTGPLFDFEHVGDLEVKGRSQPIAAYRVLGASATPGRLRGIEGLESPLVGRDREFEDLTTALNAVAAGNGQVVSIIAEAGLGKSRIALELNATAESVGVRWLEGASFSYDTTTPFAPAISLINQCVGIVAGDDNETRCQKIRDALARHPADTNQIDAVVLAMLLGLEVTEDLELVEMMMPPQLREATMQAIARHLEATALDGPLVTTFEDLHWADPATIELVERLLDATDRAPLMVLSLFRPRREEPSWEIHEVAQRRFPHRYTSVFLRPLNERQSQDLIANLLAVEGLHVTVRQAILGKAEGNPFFVEEVIRSLIDNGTIRAEDGRYVADASLDDIAVPDTLSSVIATRLDRLDPDIKRVLQAASVVGREFDDELMGVLASPDVDVNAVLADLQRRELIVQTQAVPTRAFSFKHALTMDTAYDSLLESVRIDLHRAVGKLIEERHPDRVVDLARHFKAGDEPQKAIPYLVASGDKMSGAYSMAHAIASYDDALAMATDETDTGVVRQAYEGLANAHMFSADLDATFDTYDRMRGFGEDRSSNETIVSAMNKAGFARFALDHDFAAAEVLVSGAMVLAEESGDKAGLAECHVNFCSVNTVQGRLDVAAGHLKDMLEVGKEIGSDNHKLFAMVHHANTLLLMTHFNQAREEIAKARVVAEAIDHRDHIAEILGIEGWLTAAAGDVVSAYEMVKDGLAIANEISAVARMSFLLPYAGFFARILGEYDAATEHTDLCEEVGNMIGSPAAVTWARGNRILIDVAIHGSESEHLADRFATFLDGQDTDFGRLYTGLVIADLAHVSSMAADLDLAQLCVQVGLSDDGTTKNFGRPALLQCQATVSMLNGDVEVAETQFAEATAIIESAGIGWLVPRMQFGDALISLHRGNTDEFDRRVELATTTARSSGLLPDVLDFHKGSAMFLRQLEDSDRAAHHMAMAAAVADEIASRFSDPELRTAFLASTGVAPVA